MTKLVRKTAGVVLLSFGLLLLAFTALGLWRHGTDLGARLLPSLPVVVVALLGLMVGKYLLSSRPWKARSFLPAALLVLTSSGMVAYFAAVEYVDRQLSARQYPGVYKDCYKVWAARGLVVESPNITRDGTQNSIESVRLAFESGAKGTEVDVFYDTQMQDFVVSHDRPYNLKNGKILTLGPLFEATAGSDRWFWIDFKKLRHLEPDDLRGAVARLETLATNADFKRRIYVEGEDPFNLSAFRDAGFPTIMDTHPLPDSNPFAPALINLYKLLFHFGDYTVMAMNYGAVDDPIYGPRARASLGSIPAFIYHVEDDAAVLDALAGMDPVRVILVENQSLNRYRLTACGEEERGGQ